MKSIESRLSKALLVLAVVYGSSVNASHEGRLILHNDKTNSLEVLDNGKIYPVQKECLDREIRDIDPRVVLQAHKKGLISLSPTVLTGGEDREFGIRSHVNGKGGGPILGLILGWGVRAVMYTAPVVAGVGAIVTTGPAGATVAVETAAAIGPAYIATTEGAASAAFIAGTAIWWVP